MKLIKGVKPDFIDGRGYIVRPLGDVVKEKIKSVSLINTPTVGIVRGNHYHKKETHWMYVVEGEMDYFERKANSPKLKVKKIALKAGDVLFTEAGYTHAIKFKKPSVLFYLSTLHRTKKGDLGDTFKDIIV